ncbi:MAG: hypothetical protein EBR87_03560 [Cytophagia bacterium]|nr:hypothetical protein [Cytophagia bacterium]
MHSRIQILFFVILLMPFAIVKGQQKSILDANDLAFLEQMVKDVMEASRIYPGQKISKDFGPNQTNGVLIRPGGRTSYPAFWIRDYAMSIETGYVSEKEQKHMLDLTANTQSDSLIRTKWGTIIPKGSIADHIRIDDGKPIYFPGTYSFENQGDKKWGMQPPFCDQFFFIQMAYFYVKSFSQTAQLTNEIKEVKLIDRLELAYQMPPSNTRSHLVQVDESNRGVDFGFRDAIYITGKLCYASLLKYQAARQLAYLYGKMGNKSKILHYQQEANILKISINRTFIDARGMLRASTGGTSGQADVWATSLAIHLGVLTGQSRLKSAQYLRDAYLKGELSQKGNIRHVIKSDDFSTTSAWEKSVVPINTYQNGAYWGTPVAWVCQAIAYVDVPSAQKLAKEFIQELQEGDFRKGESFGSPWECFNDKLTQNPVYLTSVAVPLIIFKKKK